VTTITHLSNISRETNLADDHSLHFFIKINTPADVVDDDDRIFDRDEQYNNVSELSTRFDGERCKFPVCGELHL
jgi:hypothetical protein